MFGIYFKHYIPLLLCLIAFICSACKSTSEEKVENLNEVLLGSWENESLDIIIRSVQNQEDSTGTLIVSPGSWEEIMEIKPIITNFEPDSSYSSSYYALDGSLIMNREGTWWVTGDSLHMTDGKTISSYKVTFDSGKIHFESLLDWDQDGKRDDLYKSTQVKIDK